MVQLRHQYSIEEAPAQGMKLLGQCLATGFGIVDIFGTDCGSVFWTVSETISGTFFETKCTNFVWKIKDQLLKKILNWIYFQATSHEDLTAEGRMRVQQQPQQTPKDPYGHNIYAVSHQKNSIRAKFFLVGNFICHYLQSFLADFL